MPEEWFRRTTWSPEARADFFAHLKRSRTRYNKAQYLRIQAGHLAETGVVSNIRAAIDLLHTVVGEYRDEQSEQASAYQQLGRCLIDLGDPTGALAAYEHAFEAQRSYPNALTTVHTDYSELVVSLNRTELYSDVLAVLDKYAHIDVFPASVYAASAARALIAAELGQVTDARVHARRALAAAAAKESGFRYHKAAGLVRFVDPIIVQRLEALAAA